MIYRIWALSLLTIYATSIYNTVNSRTRARYFPRGRALRTLLVGADRADNQLKRLCNSPAVKIAFKFVNRSSRRLRQRPDIETPAANARSVEFKIAAFVLGISKENFTIDLGRELFPVRGSLSLSSLSFSTSHYSRRAHLTRGPSR